MAAEVDLPLPPVLASDPRFVAIVQAALSGLVVDLLPVLIYMVDVVDATALPYLAEQFSLHGDGWEVAATDAEQRALMKSAIRLHQHKGTVWSVRQVFRLLGLGEVVIQEGRAGYVRDGTMRRDGFAVRGERWERWAEYRIRLSRLLTIDQAQLARQLLANIAPARCALVEIDFSGAALIRNGFARRDGTYTRGIS